ncbi:hypothetical protein BX666DRAFT_2026831 [Dichotomocladium elegans]|nr:hypothetical protein BX666DRAFT_2026831 [Dichotomocladium elegans]
MATSITDKRRVALAYDGSDDAQKLFEWAIKNVIRPDSDHVILLSAVDQNEKKADGSHTPTSPILGSRSPRRDLAPQELPPSSSVRGRLEALGNRLRTYNVSSEEHVLWGEPKVLIPRFTQNNHVDLLVVGSRGLGTVKSVFLGSVSDRCIHECPCPVLVVRNATI